MASGGIGMALEITRHDRELERAYDEMMQDDGRPRSHYTSIHDFIARLSEPQRQSYMQVTDRRMLEEGITFTLKSAEDAQAMERTIPFDFIPRAIPPDEWSMVERGLHQRVRALNEFLWDIYHQQNILNDGIVPRMAVVGNRYFRPEMMWLDVPNRVYTVTAGIDLIRGSDGKYVVLEDNLRTPSGLSYLYKCRSIVTSMMPDLYFMHPVSDVYPSLHHFLKALAALAPAAKSNPTIVLLTPGSHNSAYFEHTFLAQQMGMELVEGNDLVCQDHKIFIRGIHGLRQVDVIYRRLDDDFLDPVAFRPDSLLGVAGLMNAYRAGSVVLANAPGTGVADDKAIYSFVPDMIRYYLNETPILGNVPTYILSNPEHLEYALAHLPEMVVKETSLSGGYGMLIGPTATEAEIEQFRRFIIDDPGRYIAQPTVRLSQAPIMTNEGVKSRHIDLRAFVLMGDSVHVIPGGLTRVAMREGSLVVNSSQGGGCKDTWVLQNLGER